MYWQAIYLIRYQYHQKINIEEKHNDAATHIDISQFLMLISVTLQGVENVVLTVVKW